MLCGLYILLQVHEFIGARTNRSSRRHNIAAGARYIQQYRTKAYIYSEQIYLRVQYICSSDARTLFRSRVIFALIERGDEKAFSFMDGLETQRYRGGEGTIQMAAKRIINSWNYLALFI